MTPNVRFGIFADLHVDIMHDCEQRLRTFLDTCRKEDVDFIIELGDFISYSDQDHRCLCKPKNRPINIENALNNPTYAEKEALLSLFRNFEKPSYFVIGNHDLDKCSTQQFLDCFGWKGKSYYSYDCGGIHFIVLDGNYFYADGEYHHYDFGRYYDVSYNSPAPLPYLPPEELAWLHEDLQKAKYPSVLFSHQAMHAGDLRNADELTPILAAAPHRVILSANGHLHKDNIMRIGDTWFWNVNSMSNFWLGKKYATMRYTPEIDTKYPNIKYTAPYRDALFAIVTITDGVIDIRGRQSEFVGVTPAQQGLPMRGWQDIVSPSITNFNIRW